MSQTTQKPKQDNIDIAATSKKHLGKNTATNVMFAAFNAITSIIMVPYQVRHLGIENYGVIVLASNFVTYFLQVFTVAVTGGVGRFVTLHVSREDYDQANSYLNTQYVASVALIIVLIPLAAIISLLAPWLFIVPSGQENSTRLLFALCFASFMVSLIMSMYRVSILVSQRFDVANLLDILNQIARYSTWIIFFTLLTPRIWQIGTGYVLGVSTATICYGIMFTRLTPQLKPQLKGFDKSKFLDMIKMGGWMTVSQLGTMLYLGVDAIIINRVLGNANVGKYGLIAGLSLQMQTMSSMMMYMVAGPAIASYAKQEWGQLMITTTRAIKFMSLGMALLLGSICGLALPFLMWWLGPNFKHLYLLIWLLLPHLVLNLGMTPLFAINYAANKMGAPGIATLVGGFVKLVLALVLVKYTAWGIFALAVADIIAVSLKNLGFMPLYSSQVIKGKSRPLYLAVIPAAIIFAVTSGTGLELSRLLNLATLPRLFATGVVLLAAFGLVTYFLALNKEDRKLLREIAPLGRRKTATVPS